MNKYSFLVFQLLLFNFICIAQIKYPNKTIELFEKLDQAEMLIVNNECCEAATLYDSIFSINGFNPSPKDYWNRALLAKNSGENELLISIVENLFLKGYDSVELSNCFQDACTKVEIDNYEMITNKHLKFARNLIRKDQSANYNKNENPENFIKTILDNIEKIIEYQNLVDSLKLRYFSLETANFQVCFVHYFQLLNNRRFDTIKYSSYPKYITYINNYNLHEDRIIDFFVEQVINGNYDRSSLAKMLYSIDDLQQDVILQFNSYVTVRTPEFYEERGQLKKVDSLRNVYGLCNYSDHLKKVEYIDSKLNSLGLFNAIPQDSIMSYFETIGNGCLYKFANQFRQTMFFKDDEEAYKVYQSLK